MKLRVGVVFGGRSAEHDVSLMSAQAVLETLDAQKYQIIQFGITRAGEWLTGDARAALQATGGSSGDERTRSEARSSKDRACPCSDDLLREIVNLDVVFPVLHGTYGEDGTVQGLLELLDVPYVGSGVVGSAVCMDKAMFKEVMLASGIAIVPWQFVERSRYRERSDEIVSAVEAELPYPVFTKPANLGSSIGISKCRDRQQLVEGLNEAARHDRRLVVEQGIPCRELEVAVIGNGNPRASVVGEIRSQGSFYDYSAKYLSGDSELIIPAPLDDGLAESIRDLAVRAYQAADCSGLARVDFFLKDGTDEVYVNEINTMPGFTAMSMFPKLWEATGVSYAEVLDELIRLALDRYDGRS